MNQRVYLLRHTRTTMPPGTCCGWNDVPLAEDYPEDLAALRKRLRSTGPDGDRLCFFSSPLERCRRLARDIAQENEVVFDERLKELNFGEWEGRSWNEIQSTDGTRAAGWMDSFVETPCPGGESYRELARRAGAFLSEVPRTEKAICVVAHGGSIRALLAYMLDLPLEHTFCLEVEYGRLTLVDRDPERPAIPGRLLFLNR